MNISVKSIHCQSVIKTLYCRYKGEGALSAMQMNERYGMRPEILTQLDSLYNSTLPEDEERSKGGTSTNSAKKKK